MSDRVKLIIGGSSYSGWQSISITRSIESFAGSFSLSVTDRWSDFGESSAINDEDPCKVVVDDEVVIDGFIDRRSLAIGPTSRSFTVSGRDKSAVLADCSADPKTYKRVSVHDLATQVAGQFGIKVSTKTNLADLRLDRVVVSPGDTAFDVISRVAKESGVLAISDQRGGLILTRSGVEKSSAIIEGRNVESASADYDVSNRFHRYVVGSQIPGDDHTNGPSTTIKAVATDDSTKRSNRVRLLRPDRGMSTSFARRFADWTARTAAAKSARVTATVIGWQQSTGGLWSINSIVPIQIGSVGATGNMLSTEVVFSVGPNGERSTISLVRPDAFTPEPSAKVKRSGEDWRRK